MVKKISVRNLKVAALLATGTPPAQALEEAGYTKKTIRCKGVSFVTKDPLVLKEVERLRDLLFMEITSQIQEQMLRVPSRLADALDTIYEVMLNGSPDAVRLRAAEMILNLCKTMVPSTEPGGETPFKTTNVKEIIEGVQQNGSSNDAGAD